MSPADIYLIAGFILGIAFVVVVAFLGSERDERHKREKAPKRPSLFEPQAWQIPRPLLPQSFSNHFYSPNELRMMLARDNPEAHRYMQIRSYIERKLFIDG